MFSMISFWSKWSPADILRLRRVEMKLDLILERLGLEFDELERVPEEVRRLADDGRKIEAIKVLRELTGSSLVQAKEAVEAYLIGR